MFLEIPGMLSCILNYIEDIKLTPQFVQNFVQASLWINKYSRADKYQKFMGTRNISSILLPLLIYFDEFVAGAALGAHASATKFGAVYVSILGLPPYLASKLSSILFSMIFLAEDLKSCGNENVFRNLVKELNKLSSEGIEVIIDGVPKKMFFQCVMIIGDNLGVNSIFDMVSSFNSNYCCRFCYATSQQIKEMTEEDANLMRNEADYLCDVHQNDPSQTGIIKNSIFNSIKDFHILQNSTFDIMHDIFEGVAVYVMRGLIDYWLKKKYFTLNFLNTQLRSFDFGGINVPPEIKIDKDTKKPKLKMSSAEMRNFMQCFALIVGHKIKKNLSEDEDAWNLYVNLRLTINIVTSPTLTSAKLLQLKVYVRDLCSLYKKLFGPLKPKFHFLIHYASVLLKMGPGINFWCMRYESRHRFLKAVANAVSGSKNLLKTIAIKESLRMCQESLTSKKRPEWTFGSQDFNLIEPAVMSAISGEILTNAQFYEKVSFEEYVFKINMMLVVDPTKIEHVFGKVVKIIRTKNSEIYAVLEIFEEEYFDHDTFSFVIKSQKKYRTIKLSEIPHSPPCTMHEINGKIHITPLYII